METITDEQMAQFCSHARYWAGRYRKCFHHVEDSEEYADALVGIMNGLKSWRSDGGSSLNTWITDSIRGHILTGFRDRKCFKRAGLKGHSMECDPGVRDPVPMFERLDTDELKAMRECLAQIPERWAKCIMDCMVQSQDATAIAYGCSNDNIRRMVAHGLRRLRKLMADRGYDVREDAWKFRYHLL